MNAALAEILAILAYRGVPFVAYACASKKVGVRGKLLSVAALGLLAGAAWRLGADVTEVVVRAPIALAYFALLAVAVHRVAAVFRRGAIAEGALLVGLAVAYVFLPALAIGSPLVTATLLVGWSGMLSAYSYCVDTADDKTPPPLRECLFFLLVNPMIVWADRGRAVHPPAVDARALARVVLGVATWAAQDGVNALLASPLLLGHGSSLGAAYLQFLAGGALQAASLYLAHSGLASIEIGLARLTGYVLPERYVYPFLARSPQDFWRRWNVWVAAWARRYLFFPAALWIRRRWRRSPLDLGKAIAVVLTFVGIGLLHDFSEYARILVEPALGAPSLAVTAAFTVFGASFVAWLAIERLASRFAATVRAAPLSRYAAAAASWILFTHLTYVMVWLARPAAAHAVGDALRRALASVLG